MTYKLKYSILIPTRNGGKYVGFAVKSVLSQLYESCEVIVSVNHSSDDTLDLLSAINDPRLRIIVPPSPLSMVGHYEWILTHANGDWLTILGDDDALMPYFFREVDMILNRWPKVEAISSRRAYYFWEGCNEIYGNSVVIYDGKRNEYLKGSKKCLLEALIGLKDHSDLPQLYTNGIIRTTLVNRIIENSNNKFYYDMAPDVYSGVAIALELKCFLNTDLPLFWVGTSPKSVSSTCLAPDDQRANEFFAMNRSEGYEVSKKIGTDLWRKANSTISYVFSSIDRVPIKSGFWKHKWLEYLTFGALLVKFGGISLKNEHHTEVSIIIKNQIKKLELNAVILFILGHLINFSLFLSRKLVYIKRILNKIKEVVSSINADGRNSVPHIYSNSHLDFPNIDAASEYIKMEFQKIEVSN